MYYVFDTEGLKNMKLVPEGILISKHKILD